MLEIILGIFGSGGFGSIVGLVGGYFNRKLDLEAKRIDVEDKKAQRAHDLNAMDKEREMVTAEYNARKQLADTENEGKQIEMDGAIEVAGYAAMADSYKFAAPSQDSKVGQFSQLVRPVVTLMFFIFTVVIFYNIHGLVGEVKAGMVPADVLKLYVTIIEWALFQAGVCIGWWFAYRPGKPAKLD